MQQFEHRIGNYHYTMVDRNMTWTSVHGVKTKLVDMDDTYLANLYDFMKTSKHTYFDVDTKTGKKINEYNFTFNKIHRFYIIDISNKNEIDSDNQIRNKIVNLNETFIPQNNDGVRSIFYWNFNENLTDKTSLLDYFLRSNLKELVSNM